MLRARACRIVHVKHHRHAFLRSGPHLRFCPHGNISSENSSGPLRLHHLGIIAFEPRLKRSAGLVVLAHPGTVVVGVQPEEPRRVQDVGATERISSGQSFRQRGSSCATHDHCAALVASVVRFQLLGSWQSRRRLPYPGRVGQVALEVRTSLAMQNYADIDTISEECLDVWGCEGCLLNNDTTHPWGHSKSALRVTRQSQHEPKQAPERAFRILVPSCSMHLGYASLHRLTCGTDSTDLSCGRFEQQLPDFKDRALRTFDVELGHRGRDPHTPSGSSGNRPSLHLQIVSKCSVARHTTS